MKKYIIYLLVISIIIFLFIRMILEISDLRSYKKNQLITYKNSSYKQDSIFIVNKLKKYENTLYHFNSNGDRKKINLYPNLEITAIKLYENFKTFDTVYKYYFGNSHIFFIKEISEKETFRDLIYFDDFKYFTIPYYKDKIKDADIVLSDYYITKNNISKDFYNLPFLRMEDTVFQENMKKRSDIDKLEKLINNLKITNKKNIEKRFLTQSDKTNYKSIYDIIKELFIITQMQSLNTSFLSNGNYLSPLQNANINEIRSINDLVALKMLLSDTVSYNLNELCKEKVSLNFIPVREYWDLLNKRFLSQKIKEIEKEITTWNDETYYFYSYPDFKFMKLKIIDMGNGKIKLEKDFFNKEFLWMDSFFGIRLNYTFSYPYKKGLSEK